jgi:hypothetical protein
MKRKFERAEAVASCVVGVPLLLFGGAGVVTLLRTQPFAWWPERVVWLSMPAALLAAGGVMLAQGIARLRNRP